MYGFKKVLVKGGDFLITTYQRIDDKNAPFTFYIEGDGAAFNGKFKISNSSRATFCDEWVSQIRRHDQL